MKIIDAIWEKKNLGIDVIEISCEIGDRPSELKERLRNIGVPYSVVKIPTVCDELLKISQESEYKVVECLARIEGITDRLVVPPIYERFLSDTVVAEADAAMTEYVLDDIKTGKIFTTDRIATDSRFSLEIAGNRYSNWCSQVLGEGGYLSVAYYKDKPTAFSVGKCIDSVKNTYSGAVGGLLTDCIDSGLGFLTMYSVIESMKARGGVRYISHVSVNNLASLRMNMEFGYKITDMFYVLVRHQ